MVIICRKGQKTLIASKRRYEINKTNEFSNISESEAEKHVMNNYLKLKIPIMWRQFFKNIAENRDYIYIIIIVITHI